MPVVLIERNYCMSTRQVKKYLLMGAILLTTMAIAKPSTALEKGFLAPPDEAKPQVYWFWMNGNYTREGITADLEAMADVGIGGALFLECGLNMVAGPVRTFTPEWWELVNHAITEADRLGLQFNMYNNMGGGWAGCSGPLVGPEESMKTLVWSEEHLTGGKRFSGMLPKPEIKVDYYRDIAVLAFPVPATENPKLGSPKPVVTLEGEYGNADVKRLLDGNPKTSVSVKESKTGFSVVYEYPEPYTVRSFVGSFGGISSAPGSCELEYSNDGKTYHTISPLYMGWKFSDFNPRNSVSIPAVTAKYFRAVFSGKSRIEKYIVGDAVFSAVGRVDYAEFKGGWTFVWGHDGGLAQMNRRRYDPEFPSGAAIPLEKIIDISDKMDASGNLNWDVPPGDWIVQRIGYTPNGHHNSSATDEGRGPEADRFTKRGVQAVFPHIIGRVLKEHPKLVGNTFANTHIDSWESGAQNWNENFAEEFKKRRGYDLHLYLPAVAGGRIIDSPETTERFLWDFRRTIGELIAEKFYGGMRELAHKNGIGLQAEASGAQQFMYTFSYQKHADIPMGEFWVPDQLRADCKIAASVAHLTGRQIAAAEAFTGGSRWLDDPYTIKALGDFAFTVGVNRFVIHRYVNQPWTNQFPGMTMGGAGIFCERTNTWWDESRDWFSYLARAQFMLRQGRFVADVLHLLPEGVPSALDFRDRDDRVSSNSDRGRQESARKHPNLALNPPLPFGYDYDACDGEILETAKVVGNEIVFPSGMRYRLLFLPDTELMTLERARLVHQLVIQGAVVFAPKPKRCPDLAGSDADLAKIADELWGKKDDAVVDRKVGKGRIVWEKPFEEIFALMQLPQDFICNTADGDHEVNYIHRRVGDVDVYFLANRRREAKSTLCSFRVSGRDVELWDAESGEIQKTAVYSDADGRIQVPITFDPAGSIFVVLRPKQEKTSVVSISRDGRAVLDAVKPLTTEDADASVSLITEGEKKRLSAGKSGKYDITMSSGRKTSVRIPELPAAQEITGSWDVHFDPDWGGPASATFEKLEDWSKRSEEGIRYYSGTANYTKTITIPRNCFGDGRRLFLDLGTVHFIAHVFLNGKDMGIAWKPPYRVDITKAAKAGRNRLEVRVVNAWANRMIGDEQLPEDCVYRPGRPVIMEHPKWLLDENVKRSSGRLTYCTTKIWKKHDKLQPSGLLGPVKLHTTQTVPLK